MIVIQYGLGLSVPVLVALRHEVALPYAVEVLERFFGFVSQEAQSLVVGDRLDVITVIKRQYMQLAILNSSTSLSKQRFCLGKIR